jgi:hypothetical protein
MHRILLPAEITITKIPEVNPRRTSGRGEYRSKLSATIAGCRHIEIVW